MARSVVPLTSQTCFETKNGSDALAFPRFQGLISEILRVTSLLGEKFTFSNPLGPPKFPGVSDFLLMLMLSF